MIDLNTALIFLAINLSICIVPSAEMVVVVTQSAMRGYSAGLAFLAGICCALVVQVTLLALGVSALVQLPTVFAVFKVIGVCYLLFLAWQTFKRPFYVSEPIAPEPRQLTGLFRRGVMINISSPLTPLYLLLVVPPLINTERGDYINQVLQLGVVMIVAVTAVFTVLSVAADKLGNRLLQSEKIKKGIQSGAAITIAGFAVYLALAQQS